MNKKYIMVLILISVLFVSAGFFWISSSDSYTVKVGEYQTYGVYWENEEIGTLTFQISGENTIEDQKCYVADYLLTVDDMSRAGRLKFDKEGKLWRATIAKAKENVLKWRTEIGYSFVDNIMRVIVEDNREPKNYQETDNSFNLTAQIMVPEYSWYFLRFESLHKNYRKNFHINLLPQATFNFQGTMKVTGEETIETPAGTFDCWVVKGENTKLASWPIDKIWISKDKNLVVKAMEKNNLVSLLEESNSL